jgi:hypothetical protein
MRHADDAEPDHDTKMKLATLVRAVDPNRKILADVPMKGMPNLDDMLKLMQNINYVINNGRSSKSGYKPTTYHQAIKFISAHGPCSTEASYAAKCSSEYNEFVVAQRRSQAISHELNQDNQAIRQYTAGPGAAAAAKRLAHQHLVEMGLLERGPADASSTKGLATEVAKLARLANMQAEKLLHADQKVVTMSARTRHQACRQPHRSSRLTHSALHIHSRRSTGAHSSSTPGGSPASHRRGRATSPGEAATEGRRRNRKSKHLLGRGHEPKPSGGSVELTDFSGDASIRGPGSE